MIGGCDIVIKSSLPFEHLIPKATDAVLSCWEDGVFEQSEGIGIVECFIYKTLSDYQSWTSHGRTNENCKNMIYLLTKDDSSDNLTCVIEDDGDIELSNIINEIKSNIE
jgi:hypothetical protein